MDEEDLQERAEEFDRIFCQELGLAGPQCWISNICLKYPDAIQGGGNTVVTAAAGRFHYGAHIEASKSGEFLGFEQPGMYVPGQEPEEEPQQEETVPGKDISRL